MITFSDHMIASFTYPGVSTMCIGKTDEHFEDSV